MFKYVITSTHECYGLESRKKKRVIGSPYITCIKNTTIFRQMTLYLIKDYFSGTLIKYLTLPYLGRYRTYRTSISRWLGA